MHIILFFISILLAVIIFLKPYIGVVSIIFFQIFLSKGSEGITPIECVYLLLFTTTLLAVVFRGVNKHLRLHNRFLILAILLFILYCLISIFIPIVKNIPLLHWARQWYPFANLLLIIPIVSEFRDKRSVKMLIASFIIVGTVVSLVGIYSVVNKGEIASYISIGFPSTVYIWSTILIVGMLGYVRSKITSLFLAALLVLGIFRSVANVSRLAVSTIAIGTSTILWITFVDKKIPSWIRLRYIKMIIIGAIGCIFAFHGVINNVIDSYSKRFTPRYLQRSLLRRYLVIQSALDDWRSSPFVGQGFGYNFDQPFFISNNITGEKHVKKIHNIYVYLLSHSGLVGFSLYILILIGIFIEGKACLKYSLIKISSFEHGIVVGLFGAYIAFLFFALFSVRSMRIETQIFLALAGGIFLLYKQLRKEEDFGEVLINS